jgi:hypothetical protein
MRVEINKNITVESLEIELFKVKEELAELKEALKNIEKLVISK